MTLVGVAELKAALSSYLARVREGETVTVTDHGRPVARLVPIPPSEESADERLQALERRGLLRRAEQPLGEDFWDLPRARDPGGRALAALLADRAEGR